MTHSELPVRLNGYQVITAEPHRICATVLVQRAADDFVVATWWPELHSSWSWGHYFHGKAARNEAQSYFTVTATRNAAR